MYHVVILLKNTDGVVMGYALRSLSFRLGYLATKIRWFILADYYSRLVVQARYLYRQSDLFKMRWQEIDLDYAESSFENVGTYFFHKVKKGPAVIRRQIFKDFIFRRPARPYYLIGE